MPIMQGDSISPMSINITQWSELVPGSMCLRADKGKYPFRHYCHTVQWSVNYLTLMGFNSVVHGDQLKDVVKTFQTGCLKRLAMIAVLKCEKLSLKLLSFLLFAS